MTRMQLLAAAIAAVFGIAGAGCGKTPQQDEAHSAALKLQKDLGEVVRDARGIVVHVDKSLRQTAGTTITSVENDLPQVLHADHVDVDLPRNAFDRRPPQQTPAQTTKDLKRDTVDAVEKEARSLAKKLLNVK